MNNSKIYTKQEIFRTIIWSTLFWIVFIGMISTFYHLDTLRSGGQSSLSSQMTVRGLGFLSWLFLLPLLYLFARQESLSAHSRIVQTGRAGAVLLGSFLIILVYLVFIFGPIYGWSPSRYYAALRLVDWMWDGILFATVYLAGRLAGMRVTVLAQEKELKIAVRSSGKVELVPVKNIIAGSAQGNYTMLICEARDYLHRTTLSELLSELSAEGFLQTHRSHFIRPEQISTINSHDGHVRDVYLKNGRRIPVSKRYEKMVREVALQTV